MKRVFAGLVALVLGVPLFAAGAKRTDIVRAKRKIPNSYIIVLDPETTDVAAVADELASLYSGRVKRVYDGTLKGFSVEMTEAEAEHLVFDPRVNVVEEDGEVAISQTLGEAALYRTSSPACPPPQAAFGRDKLESLSYILPPPAMQILQNPGFESGAAVGWTPSNGVIGNFMGEQPRTGSYYAWMGGYGTTHTDTLYQDVTIPSGATTALLYFWLHVDTNETTTIQPFDVLTVQIRNTAGTVLQTLATYSNLDRHAGYVQKSFDVSAYTGQTIRVYFRATEDSSLQTSFVIDDTALNVQ